MMQFFLEDPPSTVLTLLYYRHVKNTAELRKKVADGSLKCAIIKAQLIYEPHVISIAANKALKAKKMVTKNVYTEILYNISISKNITASLQQFGAGDEDTDLMIAYLNDDGKGVSDIIDGKQEDVYKVCDNTDEKLVQKVYKLNDDEVRSCLRAAIRNKICIKDI